MKTLIIIIFAFLFASSAFPNKIEKKLEIEVKLSVLGASAGSFVITTKKIKGKIYLSKNGKLSAKKVRIPVKYLKSGIDLRDNHLRKMLGYDKDKNKKAMINLIKVKGANGKGSATFKVLGKNQKVPITYKKINDKFASANFKLLLDKFGLTGIKYMGVGAENEVNITIVMPYKKAK